MPAIPTRQMGIDIGTNVGLARIEVLDRLTVDSVKHSSTWRIAYSTDSEIADTTARLAAFRFLLNEHAEKCDRVWYEYVPPSVHSGPGAARIYGALESVLLLWAREWEIPIDRVTIAEAKKALTGDPGASKAKMVRAAGMWKIRAETHDQADALGVVLAGYKKFLRAV